MADEIDDIEDELDEDQLPPAKKQKRIGAYQAIIEDIFAKRFKLGLTSSPP